MRREGLVLQSSGHEEMPASWGGDTKAEELDRSRPRSSWAGIRNTRDGSSAGTGGAGI